jgi:hypothetical protein
MKHAVTVALCVVVGILVALSATTSAAPGLPEFSPGNLTFTPAPGGARIAEFASEHYEISCGGGNSAVGRVHDTKSGRITMTFTECKRTKPLPAVACKSAGKAAGEIVTQELGFTLGYLSAANKAVGVSAKSVAGKGFAHFECGGASFVISGRAVGSIEPTNVATKELAISFSLRELEGGIKDETVISVNKKKHEPGRFNKTSVRVLLSKETVLRA